MDKTLSFDQLPTVVLEIHTKLLELEHLIRNQNSSKETDDLLTIKQASDLLILSVPTLYGYVSRNEIPFSKRPNSKRLWFSKRELDEWRKEGRRKTIAEASAEANTYLKKKGT